MRHLAHFLIHMQWNGESNNQDIVSLTNDLVNMDDNEYPLINKSRDANICLREIWSWIHDAYGGWMYDDSNNTIDFPTATTSLVTSQKDYNLPSDSLTVRGVEIQTQNSGVWQKLSPKTEEQIRDIIAEKQFLNVPSTPMYYTPYANSVRIYPAANYSQATSLRISYDRGTVSFLPNDTTKTPGFNSLFHEAVAFGMAVLFGNRKSIPSVTGTMVGKRLIPGGITTKWQKYEVDIKKFYGKRYKQFFPDQISVHDAVREAQ